MPLPELKLGLLDFKSIMQRAEARIENRPQQPLIEIRPLGVEVPLRIIYGSMLLWFRGIDYYHNWENWQDYFQVFSQLYRMRDLSENGAIRFVRVQAARKHIFIKPLDEWCQNCGHGQLYHIAILGTSRLAAHDPRNENPIPPGGLTGGRGMHMCAECCQTDGWWLDGEETPKEKLFEEVKNYY